MAWAKLHTDILGDPKLMRAARKGARELVYLPWLIAFAKASDDSGRLSVGGEPAESADIADQIPGATRRAIAESLKNLEKIGVLETDSDGFLRFSAWERRSGTKPSDSAEAIHERVEAHRARKRAAQLAAAAALSTSGNAESETPRNALQGVSGNATEKRKSKRRERVREEGEESAAPVWVAPMREHWMRRAGKVTAKEVRAELADLVALHGVDRLHRAIDLYADQKATNGRPPKLEWFAGEASVWVERAAPIVDPETGLLNARGMALLEANA